MTSVTFFHGSNDLYGASAVLHTDAQIVRSLGYKVTVVVPQEGPLVQMLAESEVQVEIRPLRVLRRVEPLSALRVPTSVPIVTDRRPIVVIWTLALVPYLPALLARRARVILSVHEIQTGPVGAALARASSFAKLTMANSNATAAWLVSRGCSLSRLRVAYPAAPHYSPMPHRPPDGKFKALLAGRVNGAKGHLEAVEAVEKLRTQGLEISLTLAGAPFEGQEDHLHALLQKIRDLPWVDYRGQVTEVAQLIREHDVVLSASTRPESFGIIALEAWAAGRRFIGPDEGGMSEAARLVDGLLFSPRDVAALSDRLEEVAHSAVLRGTPSQDAPVSVLCTLEHRRELWKQALAEIDCER